VKELCDILHTIRERNNETLMLATLVRVRGASYRQPGARLLMNADGPLLGAISGGCLEGDVFARAKEVLISGEAKLLTYDLRGDLDLIWGSGSGCEGIAEILVEPVDADAPWLRFAEACLNRKRRGSIATFFETSGEDHRVSDRVLLDEGQRFELDGNQAFVEPILPPLQLFVFGAGDEIKPLLSMAKTLGHIAIVLDHRPAFARAARFPQADQVISGHPSQVIPHLPLDARSAVVLLSHNYMKDQEALRFLLPSPVAYIGLMGHRERGERMLRELRAEDATLSFHRVRTPVGLDIGAESPETIALSILAEIQAVLSHHVGGSLRDRKQKIHTLEQGA
jgi:xanthine dehydrogenase accessory factor